LVVEEGVALVVGMHRVEAVEAGMGLQARQVQITIQVVEEEEAVEEGVALITIRQKAHPNPLAHGLIG